MSWVSAGGKEVFQGEGAACTEAPGLEKVTEKAADQLGAGSPGKGGHAGPQNGDAGRCPLGPALSAPCLDTSQSAKGSFVASFFFFISWQQLEIISMGALIGSVG